MVAMANGQTKIRERRYLNRELQWMEFNGRVLAQATNARWPLLERIRFLNIYHSNLDEFIMKRFAGLIQQSQSPLTSYTADGMAVTELLDQLRILHRESNQQITSLLKQQLIPQLNERNIHLLRYKELSAAERDWAQEYFETKIFPVLTPIAVDQSHPFPLISSLSISIAVALKGPTDDEPLFARVKVPPVFPLWIKLPTDHSMEHRFLSTVDLVRSNLVRIFPDMPVLTSMAIRVTRNIEMDIDDEEADDLVDLISEEVRQRRFARVVRLEHGPKPDPWLIQFIAREMNISSEDIYEFSARLELKDLSEIVRIDSSSLKFPDFSPAKTWMDSGAALFDKIRSRDLLVHHPYESFASSVENFLNSAATDPEVIAIKMTLYRTSGDSRIVEALIRAAEAGKQVVCVVEIKARMDEEKNIFWAQQLEQAGVYVVYGVVGLKTHAKLALVVRREGSHFQTYCHFGTGNYNSTTAKVYTDYGLFTACSEICRDAIELFHFLTGRSRKTDYQKLVIAPISLKEQVLGWIRAEAEIAKSGRSARIIAKMNQLQDRRVIEALYKAAQAGVQIDLIVRGFCCLRPQVAGLSDSITVRSLVGRFLEHSRVMYFQNGADRPENGQFYISSADWMTRNLNRRVELAIPIDDPDLKFRLWQDLCLQLEDNTLAWHMNPDGKYVPPSLQSEPFNDSQDAFIKQAILMEGWSS